MLHGGHQTFSVLFCSSSSYLVVDIIIIMVALFTYSCLEAVCLLQLLKAHILNIFIYKLKHTGTSALWHTVQYFKDSVNWHSAKELQAIEIML